MKLTQKLFLGTSALVSWWVVTSVQGEITLTKLVSFDGINGSEPWGALVQGCDGDFYGTTSFGGAYGFGAVFKLSPSGTLTTLHSFRLDGDGAVPQAGLALGTDGHFYGTTRDAPPYRGTVFRISTNGVFTMLVRFNGNNGAAPWNGALVQGTDGNFFGTTANGGKTNTYPWGFGTVFKVTPNGLLTTLHLFDYASGDIPYGGLVEGTDGNFYGMTSSGGPLSGGTVFKLTPGGTHTRLVSFSYLGTNGLIPFSAMLQGRDGNFYGTTTQGGESYGDTHSVNGQGFGTIFRMTPDGALTTLFSFSGTNGSYPYASLVLGNDGHFYGTTLSGGAYTNELFSSSGYAGYGTVFRITTNGSFTTLASFDRTNGAEILANLTLGKDGSFYGTAIRGGDYDLGTVFRLNIPMPPTISCPVAATVECGAQTEMTVVVDDPDGDALTVVWTINGITVQTNTVPASQAPAATDVSLLTELPLGTNTVAVSVTDTATNRASCSTVVTVVDSTPPEIIFTAARPKVLWPPNHQMVAVNVIARVDDNCSPASWSIIDVESNEPVNGHGDGNTTPDWVITGDHSVMLRAERSGNGNGRIYSITIQAVDAAGNLSEPMIVGVCVPGSLGKIRFPPHIRTFKKIEWF